MGPELIGKHNIVIKSGDGDGSTHPLVLCGSRGGGGGKGRVVGVVSGRGVTPSAPPEMCPQTDSA